MHYFHKREESAEILRRVLQLMAPHKAAFHPLSYAIWYEHAAWLNPGLSREIEQTLASGTLLTDSDVVRLHALHIAARDVEAFERAQGQLKALLEDTAQGAASAETASAHFADTLENVFRQLERPVSAEALKRLVGDLLSQAHSIHVVATELNRKLAANRAAVVGVMECLERAQTEPLRDALTGLNNRHGFQRAVDALGHPPPGLQGAALLAADVDHFKRINDTHGHVIGDKVLVKIAEILRSNIKTQDIAARMGGDEFVVLFPGTALAVAAAVADQIRTAVSRMLISRADGVEYVGQVSLSIGIAIAEPDDTLESLRHRADAAMYRAKDAGRNRVSLAAAHIPVASPAHAGQQAR
jgi:diguanylate cyclase